MSVNKRATTHFGLLVARAISFAMGGLATRGGWMMWAAFGWLAYYAGVHLFFAYKHIGETE